MSDQRATAPRWPEASASDWCLFVDRDGVLNRRIEGGYVRSWAEFEWLPGALAALVTLSHWAPHVVVVTNQQGVGKGLMTHADLDTVHVRMRNQVVAAGGRIDAVLSCTHLAGVRCRCRKPRPGLAEQWLSARPHLDPEKCVVVGDSWSDIAMGRVLTRGRGTCVFIGDPDQLPQPVPAPDERYASLTALVDGIGLSLPEKETA
jgi:D-glycero-D-manno-heptose 1,7-bisphosphate phosphatase